MVVHVFRPVLPGLKYAIRDRFGDVMPLLLFLMLLSGVYGLTVAMSAPHTASGAVDALPLDLRGDRAGAAEADPDLEGGLDHGSTETEKGPDDGPARPAPTPKRVAP